MARPYKTRRTSLSSCCSVSLAVLLLAACGGAARDAEVDSAPRVFEFPEGGVDFDGPVGLSSVPYAIDRAGAFWFVGCGGLYVIHEGRVRFYDSTTSAVPESMSFIHADANDRIWIIGGAGTRDNSLDVLEHGRFRSVLTSSELLVLTSSRSGIVWSSTLDTENGSLRIRQVAPTLGQPLPPPTRSADFSVVTDREGALWLTEEGAQNGRATYRWANGAWSAPIEMSSFGLAYDVEQDVLWTYGDANARELRRVRWNGSGIEQISERGLEDRNAYFIGFGAGGRQLWRDDDELLSAEDGTVLERYPLASDVQSVRVSWDGAVYLFTPTALYRQLGDERTFVMELERFSGSCD